MEEKVNIAEILKDKAEGTKLYSPICGECKLSYVESVGSEPQISTKSDVFGVFYFWDDGKAYNEGECQLFPSREMRDWSKFAWKKGDVLVNSRGLKILFDRWANDNYTSFYAKTINLVEDGFLDTNLHTLASEKEAKSFIKCIEERFGGKLNLQTLEIQKQLEFKDGDIVCISGMGYLAYGIVKSINNSSKKLEYYVLNDMSTLKTDDWLSFEDKQIQPITETQQIILFDALAKEGKAWDAETKTLEDLPKKCEFKPMDWCLMRDICGEECFAWSLCQFAYQLESGRYEAVGSICFDECIPYNESTKHLLGTTDEWKGGEG